MEKPTSYPIEPLPSSIAGDHRSLSREAKARIKELSGPRPLRFLGSAAVSWLTIFALIVAAEAVGNVAFTILVMMLIATRQMALAYLIHEQSHYLGFNGKYGDLITNLIVGYPLLVVTVENYAQVHLPHHRFFFSSTDPDFNRKSGDEWAQPMPFRRLLKFFVQDLFGMNILKFAKGKKSEEKKHPRRWDIPVWVKPLYLLALAGVLTWFGWWFEFLIYWLIPLVTFMQIISRIGALTEHRYNLKQASLEESTPMVVLPMWQRLLIPDLNFCYHIFHHYYPGVSFGNLPKVYEIFEEEGMIAKEHVYHGYIDYFRRAVIN